MSTYQSDIQLGELYRDAQSGFQGHATCISFFEHGCERVMLKTLVEGKIEEFYFDAPELIHVATGQAATSEKKGGVRPSVPRTGSKR